MNILPWIDRIPMPVLFMLTLAFVFLAINGGIRLGLIRRERSKELESIGTVVGATLGLLAFMLAFTFNMTANRYDERKQLFLDDINTIGTVYLRAALMPEPYATEIRTLLREYVDIRAKAARDPDKLREAIRSSEVIHDLLWQKTEEMIATLHVTPMHALFVEALNEMIDLHGKRVSIGSHFRIPGIIWMGLYVVAILAMVTVGYQFGQAKQRQLLVNFILALTFSSVIMLIVDLDRALEGSVKVNQQMLFHLQEKLQASP